LCGAEIDPIPYSIKHLNANCRYAVLKLTYPGQVHYIFISVKSLTGNYLYSMSLILKVPTLNDDIQDFDRLFSLHQQAINSDKEHLILDFSDCQFLRHNAVAFLGGLVRFNQFQGKNVIISWHSIRERVCTNLKQNGFYTAHTEDSNGWSGNSIPYREERVLDKNGFLAYLRKLWLGRGWINVDEDIQREILSKVVGNGLAYGKCSTPFMGTLVNISLKCSDSQYHTHRLESSTTLF
jgi:hypothetical protein